MKKLFLLFLLSPAILFASLYCYLRWRVYTNV